MVGWKIPELNGGFQLWKSLRSGPFSSTPCLITGGYEPWFAYSFAEFLTMVKCGLVFVFPISIFDSWFLTDLFAETYDSHVFDLKRVYRWGFTIWYIHGQLHTATEETCWNCGNVHLVLSWYRSLEHFQNDVLNMSKLQTDWTHTHILIYKNCAHIHIQICIYSQTYIYIYIVYTHIYGGLLNHWSLMDCKFMFFSPAPNLVWQSLNSMSLSSHFVSEIPSLIIFRYIYIYRYITKDVICMIYVWLHHVYINISLYIYNYIYRYCICIYVYMYMYKQRSTVYMYIYIYMYT